MNYGNAGLGKMGGIFVGTDGGGRSEAGKEYRITKKMVLSQVEN
jgi:hypothetical protein